MEPDEIHEVTSFEGETLKRFPVWPAGDHVHAVLPPTPSQLEDDAHRALTRIRNAAIG
ncbi:hypothetical protein AB0F72_08960 [Actinoplanes sp. NPDC023936]|uniref:hypothetical protein n=1 Tax=Actinoplanes sp. NPDC023936 TaxID=3154910 RepID=UPI00340AB6DA